MIRKSQPYSGKDNAMEHVRIFNTRGIYDSTVDMPFTIDDYNDYKTALENDGTINQNRLIQGFDGETIVEMMNTIAANNNPQSNPASVNRAALGGNLFEDGGIVEIPDATYVYRPLLYQPIHPEISNDASIRRATHVYSNYDEAKDAPLSIFEKTQRNIRRWLKDNVCSIIPAGVSNCTLTATQWVDPTNPIKSAKSIHLAPNQYGYTPIDPVESVPGDILITRNPINDTYHTMLLCYFEFCKRGIL